MTEELSNLKLQNNSLDQMNQEMKSKFGPLLDQIQ